MTSTEVPFDPEALLREAQARLNGKRWVEAEHCCRQVLKRDPGHADALGLLGVALADGPRPEDAIPVLERHLALRPDDRTSLHRLGRVRAGQGQHEAAVALLQKASQALVDVAIIQNDLAVELDRLGRAEEALAAAGRAVVLAPDFAIAHGNRGYMLFNLDRFGEATDAELTALAHLPPDQSETRAQVCAVLVKAAAKAGRLADAEAAIRAEIAAGRDEPALLGELAALLDMDGRPQEAVVVRNDLARRVGLQASGRADGAAATVLVLAGAGGGMAPIRYLIDPEAFAIRVCTLLSADQPDAPLGQVDIEALRQADVVFSALADVDHDGGQFAAAAEVCERIGRPVLNPPSSIGRTGRSRAAELFAGVPDMVVPPVRYMDRDGLEALPIEAPLLARTAGSHGGETLRLLRGEDDKAAFLAGTAADRLLVSPFHHFQSPDGYWRKYRLIFIDRRVHPYHLAIGDDWLVHYWRADMESSDWKKAEEERFLEDWRSVFGERAARAADEAARRLDLDYGGMDCALTADGRLLLFEANASFLIHLDEDRAAFPYKHRHVPPIRDAFTRLVLQRAGAGG